MHGYSVLLVYIYCISIIFILVYSILTYIHVLLVCLMYDVHYTAYIVRRTMESSFVRIMIEYVSRCCLI